jgi:translation initiation factor 1
VSFFGAGGGPVTGDAKKPPPGSPFAALAALRDKVPVGAATPVKGPDTAKAALAPKGPARAVVRLERKGRGGKEATIVEKLELAPAELERWCKELKAALGCGGAVDGASIVLQGDLRKRVEAVLAARGVRKITVA